MSTGRAISHYLLGNPEKRKPGPSLQPECTPNVRSCFALLCSGALQVLVDMQHMEVIGFEDREIVPLPPPDPLRNYTAGPDRGGVDRTDLRPLDIVQPEGPSFRVSGYAVEWQKVRPCGLPFLLGEEGSRGSAARQGLCSCRGHEDQSHSEAHENLDVLWVCWRSLHFREEHKSPFAAASMPMRGGFHGHLWGHHEQL